MRLNYITSNINIKSIEYILIVLTIVLYSCGASISAVDNIVEKKKIKISFDYNYTGAAEPKVIEVIEGQSATPPSAIRIGYNLSGWTNSPLGSNMVDFSSLTFEKDQTFYAKWEKQSFTVSFDLNYEGATDPPPQKQTILLNEKVIKPTTLYTRNQYSFVDWYDNKEGLGQSFQFASETVTGNITLYAKWESVKYIVVFRLNYISTNLPPVEQTVNGNENANNPSPEPKRNGYRLVGWYDNPEGTGDAFRFDTTPIIETKTLYAKWLKTVFKIEFDLNYTDATATAPSPQNVGVGELARIPEAPTRTHYNFDNWYENNKGTKPSFDFAVAIDSDKTLYANWTHITYKVTFDINYVGGTGAPQEETVNSGSMATNPETEPRRDSYNFAGWYENNLGTGNIFDFSNTEITKNTRLYAIWSKNYVITFNTLGGTSINSQSVPQGGKANRPTDRPTKENFTFDNWYANEDGTGSIFDFINTIIDRNRTLYAKWNPIVHTVQFDLNHPDAIGTPQPQNVNSGSKASVPTGTIERPNYDLKGWYEKMNPTEQDTAFDFDTQIKSDKTLYAKWTLKIHTVEFKINFQNNNNDPQTQTVTNGQLAQEPQINSNVRPTGFTLSGWYENSNPSSSDTAFNFLVPVRRNIVLYAKWVRLNYTVTFSLNYNENGMPKPPFKTEQVISSGKVTEPVATPTRKGYNFVKWYDNENGNEPSYDFENSVITEPTTLYAKWEEGFRVQFDLNGGRYSNGDTTLATQLVSNGDLVTAPPTPMKDNYNFKHWYYVKNGIEIVLDFSSTIIDSDITLMVKWQIIKYNVTFDLNYTNPTIATPSPQTIDSGNLINLPTLNERQHYEFLHWYDSKDTSQSPFDFDNTKIREDKTLLAKWKKNIYIVVFNLNYPNSILTTTPQNIEAEKKAVKPTNPSRQYYTFDAWYDIIDPKTGDEEYDFNSPVLKNLTLYANWTINTYEVEFDLGYPDATNAPQKQIINGGEKVQVPQPPSRSSYFFEGWVTDSNTIYNFNTPVNSSFKLTAKWSLTGFFVDFDTDGGNAINRQLVAQNGYVANPGRPVYAGYYFMGWYKDSAKTIKFDFDKTPITEDTTIYAKYKQTVTPNDLDELKQLVNTAIATNGNNVDLNYIDTKLIKSMIGLFSTKRSFNGNISEWNTSNVEEMNNMFLNANAFNGDISKWNVSKVENFGSMFQGASSFNGKLNDWNTSSAVFMAQVFLDAFNFNQPLDNWNVDSVILMTLMFSNATKFNQDISGWNTSNVLVMYGMFAKTKAFNHSLSGWNVESVHSAQEMFKDSNYNAPLDNLNFKKLTIALSMFNNARLFNQNINSWNVSALQNVSRMFSNAQAFNQPLNNWNTSSVTYMSSIFENAFAYNQPLNDWDVSNVIDFSSAFKSAASFNKPLDNWNVSRGAQFHFMFHGAEDFNQNLESWNVNVNVDNLMFANSKLQNNLPSWVN